MSLTDVVLSLFLVQTTMAVVQLFSVRGSDREPGAFACALPSVYLSSCQHGGILAKNSQQLSPGLIEVSAFIKEDSISQWCEFNVCSLRPRLK